MKSQALSIDRLRLRRSSSFELVIDELQVEPGVILGVAGPNGSGKSTLIACLVGLLHSQTGGIRLDGRLVDQDLKTTRAIVGYIPDDEDWFVPELSAREYIALLSRIYAEAGAGGDIGGRAQELAELLYFKAWDERLDTLSHGNKKKVQLITGLMHRPRIIIIDELRNGLDPLAIVAAEQIIRAEAEGGASVVAATHDLWWAQRVATQIMLLIDGRVAVLESTKRILADHESLEQLFMQQVARVRERD